MPVLGAATLELNADSAKLEQDLGRAVGQATAFGAAIGTVLGQAINAGVSKLTDMVNKAIETGDELSKLSQKTGMTVGYLSELRVSAALADVSMGALKTSVKQLYENLSQAGRTDGKAKSALEAIGLDVEKLRALKPDEMFRTVTEQLAKYEDGANRSAIQTAILGRSGAELTPFINELGKTKKLAQELGLVFTDEMAEASSRFKDNMTISKIASEAMGVRIATVLLPTLEKLSGFLVDSAKNTEKLDTVTRAADTGLKLFATAGNIVATVFDIVGSKIGAAFASVGLAARGEFAEAFKTIGRNVADTGTKIGEAVAQIELTWTDAGSKAQAGAEKNGEKLAAPAIEAVKKIKKARHEADIEFQAFLKIRAIEDEAQAAVQKFYGDEGKGKEAELAQQIADREKMMQQVYAFAAAQDEAFERSEQIANNVGERIKETSSFAHDLGLTFTSAFEAAVIGGKKLSDVLRGLGRDIAGVILRKGVTEPLGNFLTDSLKSMDIGKLFGFRAEGGPVSGGSPYIVGERGPELFVPGASGAIVPNGGFGGGEVSITQHINIDSRSDQASILAGMAAAKNAAVAEVRSLIRRGSPYLTG